MVCDRRFTSKEQLSKHERLSTEHLSKVARRDQLENRKPIDVSAAAYTIKGEALTAAALDGDCLAIRTLLRVGADINYVHKYERGCSMRSMTPLIAAVQVKHKGQTRSNMKRVGRGLNGGCARRRRRRQSSSCCTSAAPSTRRCSRASSFFLTSVGGGWLR